MAKFYNSEISNALTQAMDYVKKLQAALYEQYKCAYKIVESPNYMGVKASSYKEYINDVSIYFINNILNVTQEIITVLTDIKNIFLEVETSEKGLVDEDTISYASVDLSKKERNFSYLMEDIYRINNRAYQYVSLNQLSDENVFSDFAAIKQNFNNILTSVTYANRLSQIKVDVLMSHITQLLTGIRTVMSNYYSGNKIDYLKSANITKLDWYMKESGDVLLKLWVDDPFVYDSTQGAVWEDQWAVGIDENTYAYFGANVLSGQLFYSKEEGVHLASIEGSVASVAGGLNSRYADGTLSIDFISGEASAKYGWTDDYKGINASGEVAVIGGDLSIVFGRGIVDLELDASGSLLSADAFINAEITDSNNYSIGAGASANLAAGTIGASLFEVETTKGEPTHLLGVNVSGSAGSVGGAANLSSTNIYDGSVVDINVTTVYIDVEFVLGVGLEISVPSVNFFGW